MAHWQSEPRYVERALLLGLPYGEYLSVGLVDVTQLNATFLAPQFMNLMYVPFLSRRVLG